MLSFWSRKMVTALGLFGRQMLMIGLEVLADDQPEASDYLRMTIV